MDLKLNLLFLCLIFVQGSTEGCVDLVEDVLLVRDGLMELNGICEEVNFKQEFEEFLGFALTSDEHWRALLCAVTHEDVDDFETLKAVLNEYIEAPLDDEAVIFIQLFIQHYHEDLEPYVADLVKYQGKLQPWLAKTNFPHTWPVPNTGKRETARMMAKGGAEPYNVLTFGSDDDPDYMEWTKALLRANSQGEYLTVLNDYIAGDTGKQECNIGLADLFRDSDRFMVIPSILQAFLGINDYMTDTGILDFRPNSFYTY